MVQAIGGGQVHSGDVWGIIAAILSSVLTFYLNNKTLNQGDKKSDRDYIKEENKRLNRENEKLTKENEKLRKELYHDK